MIPLARPRRQERELERNREPAAERLDQTLELGQADGGGHSAFEPRLSRLRHPRPTLEIPLTHPDRDPSGSKITADTHGKK
jgi:hypothetical protein